MVYNAFADTGPLGYIYGMTQLLRTCLLLSLLALTACPRTAATPDPITPRPWETISANGAPEARHEAAFIGLNNKFYLLGGRGIKPVNIFDPATKTWTAGAPSPVEIHHFQPVIHDNEIWLVGAMTGPYPGETPLPNIYIYNPTRDEWRKGPAVPEGRGRGGAGAVFVGEKLYVVCGIQDGHRGGHVPWLDEYDPATGKWRRLPDAPRPRDHFQAVARGGKIYAIAGRTTVAATNPFANTIGEVDVYDIAAGTWTTLDDPLPTTRAGNAALVIGDQILVAGGESDRQEPAHAEVELLDRRNRWHRLPDLNRGRHGTGLLHHNQTLYMASGCGNRGGSPELADIIAAPFVKDY